MTDSKEWVNVTEKLCNRPHFPTKFNKKQTLQTYGTSIYLENHIALHQIWLILNFHDQNAHTFGENVIHINNQFHN